MAENEQMLLWTDRVKKATAAKLALVDGPTVILKCYSSRVGVRWAAVLLV
jgi:hypothetical protein